MSEFTEVSITFSQLQSHTVCYIVLHGFIYLFICFSPRRFIKTSNYSNYRNAQNYTQKEKTTRRTTQQKDKKTKKIHCIQHIIAVLQQRNTFTTLLCRTLKLRQDIILALCSAVSQLGSPLHHKLTPPPIVRLLRNLGVGCKMTCQ